MITKLQKLATGLISTGLVTGALLLAATASADTMKLPIKEHAVVPTVSAAKDDGSQRFIGMDRAIVREGVLPFSQSFIAPRFGVNTLLPNFYNRALLPNLYGYGLNGDWRTQRQGEE